MPAMSAFAVGRMCLMAVPVMVMRIMMRVMVMYGMVVQMMAFHVHAAMKIAVGTMDHRSGYILLCITQQNRKEVAARCRLRHTAGRDPCENARKNRKSDQSGIWKQIFHRRLRLKRNRARNRNAAE